MAQEFTFTVNGVERTTTQNKPLLRYLRDDLHIHSAKDGCSEGACGTCTIHVDGAAVKACVLTTALAAGRNIVTVEGLPEDVPWADLPDAVRSTGVEPLLLSADSPDLAARLDAQLTQEAL